MARRSNAVNCKNDAVVNASSVRTPRRFGPRKVVQLSYQVGEAWARRYRGTMGWPLPLPPQSRIGRWRCDRDARTPRLVGMSGPRQDACVSNGVQSAPSPRARLHDPAQVGIVEQRRPRECRAPMRRLAAPTRGSSAKPLPARGGTRRHGGRDNGRSRRASRSQRRFRHPPTRTSRECLQGPAPHHLDEPPPPSVCRCARRVRPPCRVESTAMPRGGNDADAGTLKAIARNATLRGSTTTRACCLTA